MPSGADRPDGDRLGAARPGRRGVPDRHQVENGAGSGGATEVRDLQRRRGRLRDVLGSHDHGRRSVRAHRGHDDCRHRRGCHARLHLPAGRVSACAAHARSGVGGGVRARLPRQQRAAAAVSRSISRCGSGPAPTSAAKRRRCSRASRGSAARSACVRRCPAVEGLFGMPTIVNNVISLASVPIILDRGAEYYRDYGMGRSRGTLPTPARRQHQARRAGGEGVWRDAAGAALRLWRRVRVRPSDPRGAGRRSAWRLPSRVGVRHCGRLRGLHRHRRAARSRRHRRVRRQRRHGGHGAVCDGVLRASNRAASARRAASGPRAASRSSIESSPA